MDLICTKIIVAIIFGLWRIFWGTLPVKLEKWLAHWEDSKSNSKTFINERRHKQVSCYVALTQSFGGGVLFATCFLHMIKELLLSVEEIKKEWNMYTEYPISQLIIAVGFFLIYFLEEFFNWMLNKGKKKAYARECAGKVAKAIAKNKNTRTPASTNSLVLTELAPIKVITTFINYDMNHKEFSKNVNFETCFPIHNADNKEEKFAFNNNQHNFRRKRSFHSIRDKLNKANLEAIQKEQLTEDAAKNQEQLIRCVLTIAALSLHSLLEGLSMGIQKFKHEVWYLFVAISIHSASILFCMGMELILAQTRIRFIVLQMTVLAFATPTGILLGTLLTFKSLMKSSTVSVASIVLEGFSAGTILYITFFEVLNREKERRVYRLRRAICIIGGFALMALLQYAESKCEKHGILRIFNKEELHAVNLTNND